MFSNSKGAGRLKWSAAALCALALGMPGTSQIQSGLLNDLDPWSVGFLSPAETALPADFWLASDTETALQLMQNVRTQNLSPAERLLLRRLVLSPSEMPDHEQASLLVAERARIMYELGEAYAASQTLPLLNDPPASLKADETAVDLQMALGEVNQACSTGAGEAREGAFWAKLRAVCFALEDNSAGAELAIELAQREGVDDAWFFTAIFAASGDIPDKPAAQYDNGLALVLSAKAGLVPPDDAIVSSRRDLAAAIARLDTFEPSLRVQAAGAAAEAGLIDAKTHRAVYSALIAGDAFEPRTPLELALQSNLEPGADIASRARHLRNVLSPAGSHAARYAAVSRLLLTDIQALPQSDETERMALDFASACIAAGDLETAARWSEAGRESDSFHAAWIDGLILMAGADAETSDALATQLMEAMGNEAHKQAARRLFTLWSAFDIALPPRARALLAETDPDAPETDQLSAPPLLLRSISAAAHAGAGGEVILQMLELTDGDASSLAPADAAIIIEALLIIGQDDAARLFALEATGYWRSSL